ncbi:MAG TPA: autotransporter assembly complex family protein [Thermoanaerobaculia bacterium]|nr:autotransporter assembly complex family protein [Thermoanaerobaculia bacterium]
MPHRSPRNSCAAPFAFSLLLLALAAPAAAAVRVEVEGVEDELRRNVLALLSIREAGEDDLTEHRVRQLHARAPEEIEEALQPFGHYKPVIHAELTRQDDDWTALYRIDPGPPLRVAALDLRVTGPGADDPRFRELAAAFPLAPGEVLVHPAWERGKQTFVDYAASAGYVDAEFDPAEVRVDLERYAATAVLHFATGPRYRFGEVTFHQDVIEPELLRGYVTFERGDPLDVDKVLEMQEALSDSPYFARVEVVTEPGRAEGLEVPVEVHLTPAKRERYMAGLGYGTDTGARGTVNAELRRLNRQGHRGEADFRISDIEQRGELRYLVPGPYPRTDTMTYSAGYSELATEDQERRTSLVGASRTQTRGGWREAYSLYLQREDFVVGLDAGTADLLVPGASWERVDADDRIYPLHGHRLQLRLQGAHESLLSDATFLQGEVEGKLVRGLGERLRVLVRAEVGSTWTDEFRRLPPSFRFFAGGDQSVRGYGFQDLAPLDEGGNLIGGEALLTGSVEVDSLFLDLEKLGRWGAAVFYDAGNALTDLSDPLEQGAGLGLRWLSPIGLVRADAAFALSEPGTPVRFHFTIGPDL